MSDDKTSRVIRDFVRRRMAERAGKGEDLSGIDLRFQNLSGVDFSRLRLERAKFAYASLRGARFDFSDLTGVSFWRCDLTGASFNFSNLTDCDLDYSLLDGASFWGAILRRTELPLDFHPLEHISRSVRRGETIPRTLKKISRSIV